jgi:hypothetical protein
MGMILHDGLSTYVKKRVEDMAAIIYELKILVEKF